MAQRKDEHPVSKMLDDLLHGRFDNFSKTILPEPYLGELASQVKATDNIMIIVYTLIEGLIKDRTRAFDWNCGSLFQHLHPRFLFEFIHKVEGDARSSLYESIGLTWCLGEFGRRDSRVVNFLEDAVKNAEGPESWWRAGYALEKIGIVDAVSYLKSALKSRRVPDLETCLSDLGNEFHRIGILLHCTLENLESEILPKTKNVLFNPASTILEQTGAAWIIGRFRYLDSEVEESLRNLLYSESYEVKFYILQAIKEIGSRHFLDGLTQFVNDQDPLLRRMAAQGLGKLDDPRALEALRTRLEKEEEPRVLSAVTEAIYDLTNYARREVTFIRRTIGANENGMISDEGDKWYINPDIYQVFSESQDPENLCFRLAMSGIQGHEIHNPIDIGSGTGRFAWYILKDVKYSGVLYCLDYSEQMFDYLEKRCKRESIASNRIKICQGRIEELTNIIGSESSNLIIANYAFPSSVFDRETSRLELEAVYECLQPGGYLVTVGWDETFNDGLSEMWYKYISDDIVAGNFEEWRLTRSLLIESPRNCNLTWYKKGLKVYLEFVSLNAAAKVMGYLFGRSAAEEILRSKKTRWSISTGITINKKEELGAILANR